MSTTVTSAARKATLAYKEWCDAAEKLSARTVAACEKRFGMTVVKREWFTDHDGNYRVKLHGRGSGVRDLFVWVALRRTESGDWIGTCDGNPTEIPLDPESDLVEFADHVAAVTVARFERLTRQPWLLDGEQN